MGRAGESVIFSVSLPRSLAPPIPRSPTPPSPALPPSVSPFHVEHPPSLSLEFRM